MDINDVINKKIQEYSKINIYSDKHTYSDGLPIGLDIKASTRQFDALVRLWNTSGGKAKIIKMYLFNVLMSLRNNRGKAYNITGPYFWVSSILSTKIPGALSLIFAGIETAWLDIDAKEMINWGGSWYTEELKDEDKKWAKEAISAAEGNTKQIKGPNIAESIAKFVGIVGNKVDKTGVYSKLSENTFTADKPSSQYDSQRYAKIFSSSSLYELKSLNLKEDKPSTTNVLRKRNRRFPDYTYGSIVVIGNTNEGTFPFHDIKKIDEFSDKQFVPFYIKDIRRGIAILLNAYFDAEVLNERFDITVSEHKTLHRINSIFSWVNTKKSYDLKFSLFAIDRNDHINMIKKLQFIRDLVYPIYDENNMIISPAGIFKIKLGNYLNNRNDSGLYAFMTGLNFDNKNFNTNDDLEDGEFNFRHMLTIVNMQFVTLDEYPSCDIQNPLNYWLQKDIKDKIESKTNVIPNEQTNNIATT